MKLKCGKHNRRVIVGENSWLHRTGDGSSCDSHTAIIGTLVVTLANAHTHLGTVQPPRF